MTDHETRLSAAIWEEILRQGCVRPAALLAATDLDIEAIARAVSKVGPEIYEGPLSAIRPPEGYWWDGTPMTDGEMAWLPIDGMHPSAAGIALLASKTQELAAQLQRSWLAAQPLWRRLIWRFVRR